MLIQTDVAKTFWNLQNYLYEIEKQNIKNTHYYLELLHKAPKFLKNSGSRNGMNGISSWSYSSTQYWLIKDGKIISASHEIINISDKENIFVIVYNCSDGSGRFSSYQESLDITYYCNELEYKKFNDIIEELNIPSKLCDTAGDNFSNWVSTCPNCSKKDEKIAELKTINFEQYSQIGILQDWIALQKKGFAFSKYKEIQKENTELKSALAESHLKHAETANDLDMVISERDRFFKELEDLKVSHEKEINVWIESAASAIKLAESETKRANVAEKILSNLSSCRDGTRINGICSCCSYELISDCAPTCLQGYTEKAEQQLKEADNG